jgi:hypothetical protein
LGKIHSTTDGLSVVVVVVVVAAAAAIDGRDLIVNKKWVSVLKTSPSKAGHMWLVFPST